MNVAPTKSWRLRAADVARRRAKAGKAYKAYEGSPSLVNNVQRCDKVDAARRQQLIPLVLVDSGEYPCVKKHAASNPICSGH